MPILSENIFFGNLPNVLFGATKFYEGMCKLLL